jgi:hypothetical protein
MKLNKSRLEREDVIQSCLNWSQRHEKALFKGLDTVPVTIMDYHGFDGIVASESELKRANVKKLLTEQAIVKQVKIRPGLT